MYIYIYYTMSTNNSKTILLCVYHKYIILFIQNVNLV